jgi:membrane-bound serine protease (ClpP class)
MTRDAPLSGTAGVWRPAPPFGPALARRAAWIASVLAAFLLAAALGSMAQQPPAERPVMVLDIKGAIGFVAAEQLSKALSRAAAEGAHAVVIRLDTPGGLLSSTREMIQAILASPVPVVMYVAPDGARAASAGTYLTYAAHVAAMAPSTHLGAATPISLAPGGLPGSPPPQQKPPPGTEKQAPPSDGLSTAERKAINDAVAYIRSLAELRGRNADWAEKAVREAATLTATAALKEKVVDVVATGIGDLLAQIDGRTVRTGAGEVRLGTKGRTVIVIEPDWKARIMSVIADPNVALIMLLIGIYGILFEFLHPGAVAPGVVGGICLLVALASLSLLPVNYAGLALLLFGIALLVAEAFMPGFGIAGLGGIVAFALGAFFLFDPSQSDIPIAVSWQVIAATTVLSTVMVAGVLGLAVRARQRPVATGAEEMIGSIGETLDWAGGEGRIQVHGETWTARSAASLAKGQKVRVVGRTGLRLTVEPSA